LEAAAHLSARPRRPAAPAEGRCVVRVQRTRVRERPGCPAPRGRAARRVLVRGLRRRPVRRRRRDARIRRPRPALLHACGPARGALGRREGGARPPPRGRAPCARRRGSDGRVGRPGARHRRAARSRGRLPRAPGPAPGSADAPRGARAHQVARAYGARRGDRQGSAGGGAEGARSGARSGCRRPVPRVRPGPSRRGADPGHLLDRRGALRRRSRVVHPLRGSRQAQGVPRGWPAGGDDRGGAERGGARRGGRGGRRRRRSGRAGSCPRGAARGRGGVAAPAHGRTLAPGPFRLERPARAGAPAAGVRVRTGRDLPERRESGVSAAAAAVGVSVIVPVYHQAESIGGNIQTILDRVSRGLDEPVEIVVVSDGSVDQTEERALSVASDRVRVLHYERNLGKGYAIKAGALEARGEWIAFIDADLDLDPAAIPEFVRIARAKRLDFVIGSKRHPESDVFYPRSRRVASWLYQQLVRLLFRLDVRDTQVGLKVFRREIADEVMPFLLVKRFAFDLELLSVARAFGFRRIEERPVSLQYRFTGSGVRSLAVARALVDTAAIFYRLRVLRYYERRRTLGGRFGWTRPRDYVSHVTVVAAPTADLSHLDYPSLDIVSGLDRRAAAEQAEGELVAFVGEGATPAS